MFNLLEDWNKYISLQYVDLLRLNIYCVYITFWDEDWKVLLDRFKVSLKELLEQTSHLVENCSLSKLF